LNLESDTILVQNDQVFAGTVDDRVVALGIRAGLYFDFNRMGSGIWKMLSEPCRVGQIFDVLLQNYDADIVRSVFSSRA
jgi:hypothetical protein